MLRTASHEDMGVSVGSTSCGVALRMGQFFVSRASVPPNKLRFAIPGFVGPLHLWRAPALWCSSRVPGAVSGNIPTSRAGHHMGWRKSHAMRVAK